MKLLLTFALLFPTAAFSIVPQLGDVTDSRTATNPFGKLYVQLNLVGDEISDIKWVRIITEQAMDDTGKNLNKSDQHEIDSEEIDITNGASASTIVVRLNNPSKEATKFKLKGYLELFLPSRDSKAHAIIPDIMSKLGSEIEDSTLKAAEISATFSSKPNAEETRQHMHEQLAQEAKIGELLQNLISSVDNMLEYEIVDPEKKFLYFRVLKSSGEELPGILGSTIGKREVVSFPEAIPNDAQLEVFIATDASIMKVPFEFNDIYLP